MDITIKEFANELAKIVGEENIILKDNVSSDYMHDEYHGGVNHAPDMVACVSCTEEVSKVLSLCTEKRIPATVRGAGTGQVGGSVPVHGGIIISMQNMNQIMAYDEENSTIRVQAGVLLQDVKLEADKHGKYYPPDPGEKTATIGGNFATNASGPCAGKYGKTRDYIVDAVLVFADGTISNLSDNDEYVSTIGSEGTLAVVTELALKVIDKPCSDTIFMFPFADVHKCIEAAKRIMQEPLNASVVEYIDGDIVEFSGNVTGNPVFPIEMDGERVAATLMISIEGDDDELEAAMECVAELSEELECMDVLVCDTMTMKREVWAAYDAFHTSMESVKLREEINVDVPENIYADFVNYAKEVASNKGVKAMTYGHVASGGLHIHLTANLSSEEFDKTIDGLKDEFYSKVSAAGGNIAGEYGVGYAKIKYLSPLASQAHKELKNHYDPMTILNPGKIID